METRGAPPSSPSWEIERAAEAEAAIAKCGTHEHAARAYQYKGAGAGDGASVAVKSNKPLGPWALGPGLPR
jgi:hypothetical protein